MNELQPKNPEMGMKDFLTVLRRRIWLILPILLLSLGAAYLWYKHTPPTYRAESQLRLIQRAPTATNNSLDGVQSQTMETVETQVALIQGLGIAQRVAAELRNAASGQPGSTILSQDKNSGTYNPDANGSTVTYQDILKSVKVTNPPDSDVLNITADGNSPEQAENIAKAIDVIFRHAKSAVAYENFRTTQSHLQERVNQAKRLMDQAQEAEKQFKEKNNLTDLDASEKNAILQSEGADTNITALTAEFAAQQGRVASLDSQLAAANRAINSGDGVPDENLVLSLQKNLTDFKAQRADAATKYTKDYPGVLPQLDAQIANTEQQLKSALRATSNSAAPSLASRSAILAADAEAHRQMAEVSTKLASARGAYNRYSSQAQSMPSLRMKYAGLQLNTTTNTQLYQSLLGALNATTLQRDQLPETIAETEDPTLTHSAILYGPKLATDLLLGFAVGALFSLGLVMLLEQTDQRVRTLDEIRALASGPIIGMLPKTSRAQMKAMAEGRLLPEFEEAFSLVRVNLSYVLRHSMMREQVEHQTILVTSAMPGEGKSVTAAELARTMAEAGKSVILVDANLRRPSQNILFQTGETGGLTDVLLGQIPLDEAIVTSNVENLSILHSGVTEHNPTVLLSQPRLASTMEALRFKADVVIIDAPDCSSVADTLLLTSHADCLLQVVRAGFVDMDTLHNASMALHATGKKVTVLANGLSRPQQRAFKSRFAYSALSSQVETPALPQSFDKTMVMNRSRDLVFSKSARKSLETPAEAPEKDEAS